ncbi:MAG: MetQ/NlpA family ABC transporter substrate-binding protein [Acidaminococcales bacterium]|jgi:D-methionine transport system substrate-binding protein|nr:MetQ/NlpA family ABC transporter substrate-binding protein [Acidaminococcales bacterium]
MRNLFMLLVAAIFLTAGCGGQSAPSSPAITVKVGASVTPHAEILDFIKPILAKDGVILQVVEMTDYVRPNIALAEKELDANYFQHVPYLEKFASDHKLAIVSIAKVHVEPMGIYSNKIKSLAALPQGAIVAIPNDPTNSGRALMLLEKAGVIKLKPGADIAAVPGDIAENPKKIVIKELEAAQLPRSLEDVALAVINTNYALDAKLSPLKDALFIEAADSPYVNILAVRKGDENRPELKKLAAALTSPQTRKFIEEKHKGAVIPAF